MKKSTKAKRPPAQPATHPPVLDAKPEATKASASTGERHKPGGRSGPKGSR